MTSYQVAEGARFRRRLFGAQDQMVFNLTIVTFQVPLEKARSIDNAIKRLSQAAELKADLPIGSTGSMAGSFLGGRGVTASNLDGRGVRL